MDVSFGATGGFGFAADFGFSLVIDLGATTGFGFGSDLGATTGFGFGFGLGSGVSLIGGGLIFLISMTSGGFSSIGVTN